MLITYNLKVSLPNLIVTHGIKEVCANGRLVHMLLVLQPNKYTIYISLESKENTESEYDSFFFNLNKFISVAFKYVLLNVFFNYNMHALKWKNYTLSYTLSRKKNCNVM